MTGGRALVSAALLALPGCGAPRPAAIAWGADQCAYCHMTISDHRFAAQLVTAKGRVWTFDDPGCLARFYAAGSVPRSEVHSVWVHDFAQPDSLLDATRALYLSNPAIHTPMASGLAALRAGREADSARAALGGTLLGWDAITAAPRPALP